MENKDKNSSKGKRVSCAENGLIAEQYTQNGWFVKVKPIFSLDKKNEFAYNRPTILFSFVEKGKKGSGFDIYMDMDIFDLWADDVMDVTKTFKKTIEAEAQEGEKYPKTYKYITGSNGEKSVGFCKSTAKGAFATINGCTVKDGKKVFANVPVDYNWLRTCMKWYRRVTAPYYAMMSEVTRQHMVTEWYKPQEDDTVEYQSSDTECATASNLPKSDEKNGHSTNPMSNVEKPANEANTKSDVEVKNQNKNYKSLEVVTTTVLQTYGKKENLCFKAITKDNKEMAFVVMPSEIDQDYSAAWKNFQAHSSKEVKIRTKLLYVIINGKNLVKGIA